MAKFYISDFSRKYYTNYNDDTEIKRDLSVCEVCKGIILPVKEVPCEGNDVSYIGGVLNQQHKFVEASSTYRDKPQKALLSGYDIENSKIKYVDEIVIYGGILYEFYGHVLLETLSRLWYYFKHNPNKYRVVFNVVPGAYGKFKEFFELLDIPYNESTFITEPTQFQSVIVPEQASIYATNWHKDFLIPFDYMRDKVPAKKYDKVYFTRSKLTKRNPVWGEKQIENIFAKNGYKVFSPELLSLKEQIAIVKGCKQFASMSGSQNHNLLFSQKGIEVVVLNRYFEPDFCHFIVDYAKEHQVSYVDISLSFLPITHVHGPWIVGMTEELRTFFKDYRFVGHKKCKTGWVFCDDVNRFLVEWLARNQSRGLVDDNILHHIKRIKIKNYNFIKYVIGKFKRIIGK